MKYLMMVVHMMMKMIVFFRLKYLMIVMLDDDDDGVEAKIYVMMMTKVMTLRLKYAYLQISQLMQFAEALLEYHKQCSEILQVVPSG